jgi:protein TonB
MSASTAVTSGDRLTFTLFVALVLHAVILFGVTFVAPHIQLPHVMEVTLALHRSDKANPNADFLAQANQEGSGSADDVRVITSPHQSPFTSDRINDTESREQAAESRRVDETRRQVVTTTAHQKIQHDNRFAKEIQEQQLQAQDPQLATTQSLDMESLEARLEAKKQAYAKRPKIRVVDSLATREDRDAAYLDAFRAKVELLGNQHYPELARQRHLIGNVRLLVSLWVDGRVEKIEVLRSSGYPLLDSAAIQSVRLGEPYPPFPVAMRRDTDELQIIRTWKFTESTLTSDF